MDHIENDEGDEAGQEVALYLLDDHRFVYGNPDAEVQSSFLFQFYLKLMYLISQEGSGESAQPFQGSLVLETFTFHIRQVVYLVKGYKKGRHAIGALGLCAAAVRWLKFSPSLLP